MSCCCGGGAACEDCGYQDAGEECDYDTEQAWPITFATGSQCNEATFEEPTNCIECLDCDWTGEWHPEEWEVCLDRPFTQTRVPGPYADPRCVEETRDWVGTGEPCDFCADCGYVNADEDCPNSGDQFEQIVQTAGSDCNGVTIPQDTTCKDCYPCNFGEWEPPEESECLDNPFTQTRSPGVGADPRCVEETREWVGTGLPCDDTEGWRVQSVGTATVPGAACQTTATLDAATMCAEGTPHQVAQDHVSGYLEVDCSSEESGYCRSEGASGTYSWQEATYDSTTVVGDIATVVYLFEDCGLPPADFSITVTLVRCW